MFPNPYYSEIRAVAALLLGKFPESRRLAGPTGLARTVLPRSQSGRDLPSAANENTGLSCQVLFPVAFSSRTIAEMFKLEMLLEFT